MKSSVLKKILSSVCFVLILALLLVLLSYAFYPNKDENKLMQDVKPDGLLAEPDNSLDVIFFGDSEVYTSVSPVQMWKENGFTSYACASAAQYISLTDSFIHQALEHQQPKVIVIDANVVYRKMISDNALATATEEIFSIFQHHNRWKTMSPIDLNHGVTYTIKDDLKGFKYNNISIKGKDKKYMRKTDEILPISEMNKEHIRSISKFCNEKNVKLLLVSSPSSVNWNYRKHNGVQQLADEIGVPYLDLNLHNDIIKINWKTDSADAGDHLNFKGATKSSAFLGKYIAETYDLTDHRKDPAYSEWNDLILKYKELTKQN